VKVCMITSSYPRYAGDGAGSFVGSLARSLVSLGHPVHVIAPYDPMVEEMDQGGVSLLRFRYAPTDALHLAGHGRALEADMQMKWRVPLLMPGFVAAAAGRVIAAHRRERFDLIHAHWAVPGGAIGALSASLVGLPLVISLHGSDLYVAEHNALYAAAARFGFRCAWQITACSDDLRQRAMEIGADAARITVLPYGVDVASYTAGDGARMRARLDIPRDAVVIGTLGRLVRKKGFSTLIAAMPEIMRAYPRTLCVIGGAGDLGDELQSQASRLGMAEHVLFPGHIDWQHTPDFYAMCDLFVVPSVIDERGNVDGLPNVLLEAMASGCAIVASRVAGIPAAVKDRLTGVLVPPGDVGALARALLSLLGDANQRMALGKSARERMAREYNWLDIARRVASIYEAVTG